MVNYFKDIPHPDAIDAKIDNYAIELGKKEQAILNAKTITERHTAQLEYLLICSNIIEFKFNTHLEMSHAFFNLHSDLLINLITNADIPKKEKSKILSEFKTLKRLKLKLPGVAEFTYEKEKRR